MRTCFSENELLLLLESGSEEVSETHLEHLHLCPRCAKHFHDLSLSVITELPSDLYNSNNEKLTVFDPPQEWDATLNKIKSFSQNTHTVEDTSRLTRVNKNLAIPKMPNDRFQILEKIGSGGMGTVFRAYDQKIRRTVAIKVLSCQFATYNTNWIEQEAIACAQVEHTNVIPIYSIESCDDQTFLVMQYIDGKSFAEMIKTGACSDVRQVVHIVVQVAEGIAAAHELDILHRDIKPGNIMFNAQSQVAKIGDFGLATFVGQQDSPTLSGTPEYMSPECKNGSPPSKQSDIYSLGMTLFHALTGALPNEGSEHEAKQTVTRDLMAIVEKATDTNVDRRYANMHQLASDLRTWLQHEPIVIHPSTIQKIYSLAKKYGLGAAAITVGIITIAALLLNSGELATNQKSPKQKLSVKIQALDDKAINFQTQVAIKRALVTKNYNPRNHEIYRLAEAGRKRIDFLLHSCEQQTSPNLTKRTIRLVQHWAEKWLEEEQEDLAIAYLTKAVQIFEKRSFSEYSSENQLSLVRLRRFLSNTYFSTRQYQKYWDNIISTTAWLNQVKFDRRVAKLIRLREYEKISLMISRYRALLPLQFNPSYLPSMTKLAAGVSQFESIDHDILLLDLQLQLSLLYLKAGDYKRAKQTLTHAQSPFLDTGAPRPQVAFQATKLWMNIAKVFFKNESYKLTKIACDNASLFWEKNWNNSDHVYFWKN